MRRLLTTLLAGFRTGARTVGISPKALGVMLTGAIVWLLRQAGILELSAQTTALIGFIASTIAAVLLPPGEIAVPAPKIGMPSDQLLSNDVRTRIETPPPTSVP